MKRQAVLQLSAAVLMTACGQEDQSAQSRVRPPTAQGPGTHAALSFVLGEYGPQARSVATTSQTLAGTTHVAFSLPETLSKQVVFVDGTPVYTVKGTISPDSMQFGPNNRRLSFVAGDREAVWVVQYAIAQGRLDEHERYEAIDAKPEFSHDGNALVYAAQSHRRWMWVVNGKEGPSFEELHTYHAFSPDGLHFASMGRRAGSMFVAVDDQIGPPVDSIESTGVFFSNRGYAYVGHSGQRSVLVVNGRAAAWSEAGGLGYLRYNRQGQLAYSSKQDDKWRVVFDGVTGPAFDAILDSGIVFSEDGENFAYGARAGSGYHLVVGEVRSPRNDGLSGYYGFLPGTSKPFYFGRRGSQWRAYIDGIEGPAFDSLGRPDQKSIPFPWMDRDGTVTYLATRKGSSYLVTHSETAPPILAPIPEGPKFFAPGTTAKNVVFSVAVGSELCVFVGGERQGCHEKTFGLSTSRVSGRFGYAYKAKGRTCVTIDGVRDGCYEDVGETIQWGPSGSDYAYAARDRDRWFVVVNGVRSSDYDWLLQGCPKFNFKNDVDCLAADGGRLFRLQYLSLLDFPLNQLESVAMAKEPLDRDSFVPNR